MPKAALVALYLCFSLIEQGCSIHHPHAATDPRSAGDPIERPLTEVRDILRTAEGNQTARIPRGRYVGDFGVKVSDRHGLTIECEPGVEILVRDTESYVLLIEHCEKVTVSGGLWRHVVPQRGYTCHGPVVAIEDSQDIRIEDAVLDGCGAIGVSAAKSSDIAVERCLVTHNTFTAFYLESCDGFEIFDSIIRDNGGFLSAYRTSALEMSGNVIGDNGGHFRTPGVPGPGTDFAP
ncbi:MAG: right-handed parallel beta-helix repeat-containing protein [Planctomycetota bacterium]